MNYDDDNAQSTEALEHFCCIKVFKLSIKGLAQNHTSSSEMTIESDMHRHLYVDVGWL